MVVKYAVFLGIFPTGGGPWRTMFTRAASAFAAVAASATAAGASTTRWRLRTDALIECLRKDDIPEAPLPRMDGGGRSQGGDRVSSRVFRAETESAPPGEAHCH